MGRFDFRITGENLEEVQRRLDGAGIGTVTSHEAFFVDAPDAPQKADDMPIMSVSGPIEADNEEKAAEKIKAQLPEDFDGDLEISAPGD
jgi:hypothetical protein